MQNNVPTWEGVGYGSTTMNIAGVGDRFTPLLNDRLILSKIGQF
jgi:hypothetical protein